MLKCPKCRVGYVLSNYHVHESYVVLEITDTDTKLDSNAYGSDYSEHQDFHCSNCGHRWDSESELKSDIEESNNEDKGC